MTRYFAALWALLVLSAGCNTQPPPAPPVAEAATSPAPETDSAGPDSDTSSQPTGTVADAASQPTDTVSADQAVKTTDPSEDSPADASTSVDQTAPESSTARDDSANESLAPAAERIVLLAPDGPLLVDLQMSIDGGRPEEAMQQVVERAIEMGDVDGDGVATWDEVTKESPLRFGELGNVVPTDETERMRLLRLYDVNGNGLADREELIRFVTRNAGASRAFNLRSSNYYRGINRLESPVRKLLDVDGNGRLSPDEIEGAVARLKSRDADDDEMLVPSEFQLPDPNEVAPLVRRRPSEPDTAHALAQVRDWSQFLYALEEMYALGQPLARRNFAAEPELFDELDADGDGRLTADEITRLADVPPHVVFELRFGAFGDDDEEDRVSVIGTPRASRAARLPADRAARTRLACRWRDALLTVFVQDAIPSDYNEAAAAQLASYDTDNNGYLEESEAPPFFENLVGPFSEVDSDGDGKVYPAEMARSLELRQAPQRSQLRARAGEARDALFGVFDVDDDGRLTARELLQATQRLTELDANQDGIVDVDELPTSLLLGVVRANPQMDDPLFNPPANPPRKTDAPNWFVHMDENRDGDIARREFLGPMARFDLLDRDQDGLLTVDEATADVE